MENYPLISLRAARVNADLTLSEAANKLDISKETLRNYEHGRTSPDWDMVNRIESVYKFPSDYIFFGKRARLKRETDVA